MKDVMGILYTSRSELSLRELTANRSVAALPVAARYRLVDFLLSSLVNSGVRNVGVMMQGNYHSLMDHLETGKAWDLHTRNNGLFILPPRVGEGANGYVGVMDALRANLEYLRRSKQEFVLLMGGRMVFNTCFNDMFKQHIENNADVTVMYTKYDPITFDYSSSSRDPRAFVNVNDEGVVTDMEINPNAASYSNILMDVVLMKRTLLMHLADQAFSHGLHDMNRDILQEYVKSGMMRVMGYPFNGYCRRIETIKSYYRMNMDLLDANVRKELFSVNPVFTKTRDDAPAKYLPGAKVTNSLIADGCVIEGTVENCVLFRGTHIARGAHIKGSIIMQDGDVGAGVELENVILDKDVTILSGGRLISEKQYPIVIGKNVTL
ncbi:MAG: glucose-1-phosphate adenylyltransferase subunit GlgD [Clostridia bacterium]|nr:glucose-1-phosphate adenylyltransferase subunit GlgD [Clostridia bacterium]